MKVVLSGEILVLKGLLDECVSASELLETFKEAKSTVAPGQIRFDLSQVRRSNSTGLTILAKVLEQLEMPGRFINTPTWLVEQFVLSPFLLGDGRYVESFYAPYFNEKNCATQSILLHVGKDIPILEEYSEGDLIIQSDNLVWEPDFEPEVYLRFITTSIDTYREKFQ